MAAAVLPVFWAVARAFTTVHNVLQDLRHIADLSYSRVNNNNAFIKLHTLTASLMTSSEVLNRYEVLTVTEFIETMITVTMWVFTVM